LQLQSFQQRGKKKTLRVNADPLMDSGDSHAPVPFYVTSAGYAVLVDTARYATFYCGSQKNRPHSVRARASADTSGAKVGADALPEAYSRRDEDVASEVLVEIPFAQGVDVYIFAGPEMREAVQRYNLFSGGGVLPPRWGLGFWYRCKTEFSHDHVMKMADELRERLIPCDVLGLEPGWHSQAYSCSFTWSALFPDPKSTLNELSRKHFKANLWEHAFTHPTSPIYGALLPHSGDYEVWDGIVPDFLLPEVRQTFADFHFKEHLSLGVSGYKLDECDSSDFTGGWSFPESSQFPSGADGEQMHSLLGMRYQDAIQDAFELANRPTYGLVRNAHALQAPYPYVLYSDLYDHRDFINAVAQSSFSGLLWTPEVRHAVSTEDLVRRLQSVVFSPLAMVNAWYLWNPPWKQTDGNANNQSQFMPGWEATEALCREVIEWRMRFIPYLQGAFARYQREGLPPFRALVLDYPNDPETREIRDQYLIGDHVLVAPLIAGEMRRRIYLPAGEWFDFWSGELLPGGQWIEREVPLNQILLYVKSGTVLPLAQVAQHADDPAGFILTVRIYGDGSFPAAVFNEKLGHTVAIVWNGNEAGFDGPAGDYSILKVKRFPGRSE
jgi:alpha-D-xyloside xylohydrolase